MLQAIDQFSLNQSSPNTARMYRYQVRQLASWLQERGIQDWADVTAEHLLAYKQDHSSWAPATMARVIVTLRRFFAFAEARGWVKINPAMSLSVPRTDPDGPPVTLDLDESQRLLATIDRSTKQGRRDYAILWLMLGAGLRVGEAAQIKIGDVIPPRDKQMAKVRITGKGGRSRFVPLAPPVYAAVLEHLAGRGAAGKSEPLFPVGKDGRRIAIRTVQHRVAHYFELAGLGDKPRRSPHVCRHSFATRLLMADVPGGLDAIRRLLGHRSLSTTQRYLHLDIRGLEAAVGKDPLSERPVRTAQEREPLRLR